MHMAMRLIVPPHGPFSPHHMQWGEEMGTGPITKQPDRIHHVNVTDAQETRADVIKSVTNPSVATFKPGPDCRGRLSR